MRPKLSVFGDDYPAEDETCIRDYIHVVDLDKAHVAALKRLLLNKNLDNYEVFNIGTGKGSYVLEVVRAFEKVSSEKLNYHIVDRRTGDVVAAFADTVKANKVLQWKAELGLKEALASAWKWEQSLQKAKQG